MIYYNYPPYYFSPSNHYSDKKPSKTYSNYFSNSNMHNTYHYNSNESTKYSQNVYMQNNRDFKNKTISDTSNIKSINHQYSNNEKKDVKELTEDKVIFEIFGIKLCFDDILLIYLIFFLYTEGVQDQYLFIALILLLLS